MTVAQFKLFWNLPRLRRAIHKSLDSMTEKRQAFF